MFEYQAIISKVRGMSGKLLKEKDYQRLATSNSIYDFYEELKTHSEYANLEIDEEAQYITRQDIELLLKAASFETWHRLYVFANQYQRAFLEIYLLPKTNDILKLYVRRQFDENFLPALPKNWDKFAKEKLNLSFEDLIQVQDIKQMRDLLNGTAFKDALPNNEDLSSMSVYEIESLLDHRVFVEMARLIRNKLKKKDQKVIEQFIGYSIDLENILTVYRILKFYPNSDATFIRSSLIPFSYKLKGDDFERLSEAVSPDDLKAKLNTTYYGELFNERGFEGVNQIKDTLIRQQINKTARSKPYSIATIYQYLNRRFDEEDYLTSLLEAIYYQKPVDYRQVLIKDYIEANQL